METATVMAVVFRFLHIFSAMVVVGGVTFMSLLLPPALGTLDVVPRTEVFLRFRRLFKLVVHAGLGVLLVSGGYNLWRNWGLYRLNAPATHLWMGLHLLLGLGLLGVLVWVTAGRQPPRRHRGLMGVGVVLAVLLVLAGGTLKWARERGMMRERVQGSGLRVQESSSALDPESSSPGKATHPGKERHGPAAVESVGVVGAVCAHRVCHDAGGRDIVL